MALPFLYVQSKNFITLALWVASFGSLGSRMKVGETIGQLAQSAPGLVERLLGRAVGRKLKALAWNQDPRVIQRERRAHSA